MTDLCCSGNLTNHSLHGTYHGPGIKAYAVMKCQKSLSYKACSNKANMLVQHRPTLLDATCWPRLNTMLEDVGLILIQHCAHLKSTHDDWHRFHGDLPFYRAKTKMAENEIIVELSVLNPNSIEELGGKENIDPTSTTPSDQKKKRRKDEKVDRI